MLPRSRGLPRYAGGSASAPLLSRPAQALLTLRPAGSLNRPRRPLSRGFDPTSYPAKPLVSYQSNRQLSGWNPPPLVVRAFGAHVESRTGAVAWAIRRHPVSRPRSSNAACGFPALRSPTGFTAMPTTRPVIARVRAADTVFASPQSSFRRLLALQVFAGSRQSPCPRHPQKRTRSQGPSLHRRYPASAGL